MTRDPELIRRIILGVEAEAPPGGYDAAGLPVFGGYPWALVSAEIDRLGADGHIAAGDGAGLNAADFPSLVLTATGVRLAEAVRAPKRWARILAEAARGEGPPSWEAVRLVAWGMFPHNVNVAVPAGGESARLDDMLAWCREHLPADGWTWTRHAAETGRDAGGAPIEVARFYFASGAAADTFQAGWSR